MPPTATQRDPSPATPAPGRVHPRAWPSSPRGQRTVEQILRTTIELGAEVGFEAINTNLIAARAGVNIASVYKYFPNKQAIFLAISRRMGEAFQAEIAGLIAQIDAGRPWREAVAEGVRLASRRRLDAPGERTIRMAIRLSPDLQGRDAEETAVVSGMLAGLIARRSGVAPARANLVGRVAIELATAILDLLLTEPADSAQALAEEAGEAFIRYLAPWMEGGLSGEAPPPPPSGR